jgi:hypothetical protein
MIEGNESALFEEDGTAAAIFKDAAKGAKIVRVREGELWTRRVTCGK